MSDLVDRMREALVGVRLVSLATVDECGRPWVRYVMAHTDDDLTMRIATVRSSRKVAHILRNPEVHMCGGVSSPGTARQHIRIQGRATVSTGEGDRLLLWNDRMKARFSGPGDPDFAVVIVRPYRIELEAMDAAEPVVWQLDA